MHQSFRWLSAFLTVVLILPLSLAKGQDEKKKQPQRPQGRRIRIALPPTKGTLIRRADVQKELGIDEEQQQKLKDVLVDSLKEMQTAAQALQGERTREKFVEYQKNMRKANKMVEDQLDVMLKPEQAKRLMEITLQIQGVNALNTPPIIKELNISKEQRAAIQKVWVEAANKRRKLRSEALAAKIDRKQYAQKLQETNKEVTKETMEVLSKEQKEKLQKLKGKPFKRQPQRRPQAKPKTAACDAAK